MKEACALSVLIHNNSMRQRAFMLLGPSKKKVPGYSHANSQQCLLTLFLPSPLSFGPLSLVVVVY